VASDTINFIDTTGEVVNFKKIASSDFDSNSNYAGNFDKFASKLDNLWQKICPSGTITDDAISNVQNKSFLAEVPGCVHTDLLANGQINHPYIAKNETAQYFIGENSWQYSQQFALSKLPIQPEQISQLKQVSQSELASQSELTGQSELTRQSVNPRTDISEVVKKYQTNYDLCFDGLDTVAEIKLNNKTIGLTQNMWRKYRYNISQYLQADNNLQVNFLSPIKYANYMSFKLGPRPVDYQPYNAIRKMPCSFGWDWGINTATSGIYKPVYMELWQIARIDQVIINSIAILPKAAQTSSAQFPLTQASGLLDIDLKIQRASDAKNCQLQINCKISRQVDKSLVKQLSYSIDGHLKCQIDLDKVDLWYPRDYGEQNLYNIEFELVYLNDKNETDIILDKQIKQIGFKKVELDMSDDKLGQKFQIRINNLPIFIKGANWIPPDALLQNISGDNKITQQLLDLAIKANMNLIRVWGGGIYASDEFYDFCDKNGLLVWQDCLFACAAYAELEPLFSEIKAEVYENLTNISHRASLCLINGNNENTVAWQNWGWQKQLDKKLPDNLDKADNFNKGQSWGYKYYYEIFPEIVSQVAKYTPYTPTSPYTPSLAINANDDNTGSMHIWDAWQSLDYLSYLDKKPRFVAEFGWQSPAAWSSIKQFAFDNPLTPESPDLVWHQRAFGGNNKLTAGLLPHLKYPTNMSNWHWAMQLNQAWALKVGIEHFRSLKPDCSGAIFWQLNDYWPVTSWSVIDYYAQTKPAFYAVKQAYEPILLTIGDKSAIIVNDTLDKLSGVLQLTRFKYDGTKLAYQEVRVDIEPNGLLAINLSHKIVYFGDKTQELIFGQFNYHTVQFGNYKAKSSNYKTANLNQTKTIRNFYYPVECRDSKLAPKSFTTSVQSTDYGYKIILTATSLTRDVFISLDKLNINQDKVLADQMQTLLAGETCFFKIKTNQDFSPEYLVQENILRSANQLV
jgi:beta-mannosidase